MAQKQMGINMIEMYVNMVKEEFEPLMAQLNARETVMRSNMEVEVRKELGIYNMTIKKHKLQAELDELNRQLKEFEDKKHYDKYGYSSRISQVVDAKMAERKNGIRVEIESLRDHMIKRIKLAGLTGDIKQAFDDLPKLIEPLKKKLKELPAPKAVKRLK